MEPPDSAFYDLYYLLARGYPRQSSLELVRLRYTLAREASILLSRCIHPPEINNEIKRKKQSAKDVENKCLVIDGFNQLTTIYAAMTGSPLYLCSDTLLRDALLAGPRLVIENIGKLTPLLQRALEELSPAETIIVLDSQPSHSGDTAAFLRRTLGIDARAVPNADKEVIKLSLNGCIAATSDIAITLRVPRVFDLAYYTTAKVLRAARINNIPRLLERQHQWWCQGGPVA